MNEEKLLAEIESVNLRPYDLDLYSVYLILNLTKHNALSAALYAFRYGFLKGQRARRSRIKRVKKTHLGVQTNKVDSTVF